jgi:hypothetical protein
VVATNVSFNAFDNIGDWEMASPMLDDDDSNGKTDAYMDVDIPEDEMMHCDFYTSESASAAPNPPKATLSVAPPPALGPLWSLRESTSELEPSSPVLESKSSLLSPVLLPAWEDHSDFVPDHRPPGLDDDTSECDSVLELSPAFGPPDTPVQSHSEIFPEATLVLPSIASASMDVDWDWNATPASLDSSIGRASQRSSRRARAQNPYHVPSRKYSQRLRLRRAPSLTSVDPKPDLSPSEVLTADTTTITTATTSSPVTPVTPVTPLDMPSGPSTANGQEQEDVIDRDTDFPVVGRLVPADSQQVSEDEVVTFPVTVSCGREQDTDIDGQAELPSEERTVPAASRVASEAEVDAFFVTVDDEILYRLTEQLSTDGRDSLQ